MDCSWVLDVVEVSPRDGLQNESQLVPAAHKAELVLRAIASGAKRVEAVSFVSPRAVPQMADAEEVLARIRGAIDPVEEGVSISGLVLNPRGLDRALSAGIREVNLVVLASESFNRRNQGVSIEHTLGQFEAMSALARQEQVSVSVTIGASFGCPFEGEVPVAAVGAIAEAVGEMGVAEIALADTIGVGDPLAVESRFAAVRTVAPGARLRCHFHDTRNTGLANVYAAWRSGVRAFDASIGGIGGCPFAPAATGNIASEDLVYMLSRMGCETGLDLELLRATAGWLQDEVLGKTVPSSLLRAGGFPGAERNQVSCV